MQPPKKKSLLEHCGVKPSTDEGLKRKAAALYEQTKQESLSIRPSRPRLATPEPAPATGSSNQGPQLPSLEQLQQAPRFGLNARELILRATAQMAQEVTPAASVPAPSNKPTIPQRPAAPATPQPTRFDPNKLLQAVPFPQRPQVTYSPRCSVPRLQRQACSDTLLGHYLGLLLTLCKLATPSDPDVKTTQAIQSNETVRKVASTCASAHEAALYKEICGKEAYVAICRSSKAQPTLDTLSRHAGAALQPLMQQFKLTEQDLRPAAPQPAAGKAEAWDEDAEMSDEDLFGEKESEEIGSESEGSEEEEEGDAGGQGTGQDCMAVMDQNESGTGSAGHGPLEAAVTPQSDPQHASETGQGGSGDVAHVDFTQQPACGSSAADTAGTDSDQQPGAAVAQAAAAGSDAAGGTGAAEQGPAHEGEQGGGQDQQQSEAGGAVEGDRKGGSAHGVAEQVAEFTRGILEPYIRAQLLSKPQYKEVIRKTVQKVLSHHKGATSAAFLLKEHEAVRRLVVKLVETVTQQA